MNESKSLLTTNYRLAAAESFVSSVGSEHYYLFTGNHINSNTIVTPYDNTRDTLITAYYGMISGKKITPTDINLMIRRVDWETGVIYDVYDHNDPALYNQDFYVVVQDGNQYDVFKCLENGNGSPSLVAPSRINVSINNDDFFYPTDGYRWKYMYSVSSGVVSKFATAEYFPVIPDENVKSAARAGSIDVIKVVDGGLGYNNYLNGIFGLGDIRLNGDPKKYGISTNGVNTANAFYEGCCIYISSGAGAGQFRTIDLYTSNATHNVITLDEPFDVSDTPENGSAFEISPSVRIVGDGQETTEAIARAIINTNSGNNVSRVEMLNKGINYNLASATIRYAGSVGVTEEAQIVPIYSPTGGHGYNAASELGSKYTCVSVTLDGTESNTIVATNDYSQIGIIKNPKFRKVTINISNKNRDFTTNEWIYKINPIQLAGTVQTTVNSNNQLTSGLAVSGVNAHLIVAVNDQITVHNGTDAMIANVVSVSPDLIVVDKAATLDTGVGSANIFLARVSASGKVDGHGLDMVELTDSYGVYETDDIIIGGDTGTYATVSSVKITDVTKTFSTFNQCHKYEGSVTVGTFQEDEIVYQVSDNIARGNYHSAVTDGGVTTFYVTNQVGTFNTFGEGDLELDHNMVGDSSGAIAALTNKYSPDLVFGSGEVIYIENSEAIERSDSTFETFKLIFSF
jgi:hypothetical protein